MKPKSSSICVDGSLDGIIINDEVFSMKRTFFQIFYALADSKMK